MKPNPTSVLRIATVAVGEMQLPTSKETDSNENLVASVEFVLRDALHESAEVDFVRSIASSRDRVKGFQYL